MESVRRLITYADIDDRDPRSSIHARLVAELSDGRHIILLDDRGWTSGHSGIAGQTLEDVEQTARMVVGPDEPAPGWTCAQMEAGHWATLAERLDKAGIDTAGIDLNARPHDVEISDRLRPLLRSSDHRTT